MTTTNWRSNVVWLFSVISVLVMTAALAVTLRMTSGAAQDGIIKSTQDANMAMTMVFVNQEWSELGPLYTVLARLPPNRIASRPEIGLIDEAVRHFSAGTDILKIKIYALDGLTIYSSDPRQIGEDKAANPGFQSARRGVPESELIFRGQFSSFDGDVHQRNLISSYLPVRVEGGPVEAVVELYTDRTAAIFNAQRADSFLALVLVPLFYSTNAVLIVVVWRVNRSRQSQNVQLETTSLELAAMAEEYRVAREAAEAADLAKSHFLAQMSHEIRTPMNGVLTMAEMLESTELDDEQKMIASVIRESGEALLTIIDDILDLSKIEAGHLKIEKSSLSLCQLTEAVCEMMRARAWTKGVELVGRIDPTIADHRLGDAARIRQVLTNLVGNAVKFTERGSVRVAVTQAPDAPGTILFRITDTGIGIPEADLPRLFRPFEQAEAGTARRFGGTGLGLSISRALVSAMGGQIGVESVPDQGSTFWFSLDLEIRPERRHLTNADLRGASIALVGMSEPLEDTVALYMEHVGATVLRCGPRPVLPATPVNLVLMSDGTCTRIKRLQAEAPHGAAKLICLRSRTQSACGALCPAAASTTRPIHREVLVRTVGKVLGRIVETGIPTARRGGEEPSRLGSVPPDIATAEREGVLILVAEDNATNQTVIMMLLARMGLAAELAANGREALAMLRQRRYGLLLTDCAMPEMDGYELTMSIRGEEAKTGQRLPIVALTADALPGTAERCRAVGMDDYLPKPLSWKRLDQVLQNWLPRARQLDCPPQAPEPSLPMEPVDADVDFANLREIAGDDMETIRLLLGEYRQDATVEIAALIAALAAGERETARRLAHAAAGAARTAGMVGFSALCSRIERLAASDDDMDGPALGQELRDGMVRVNTALMGLLEQLAAE